MMFTEEVLTRVFPFPQERLPSEAVVAAAATSMEGLPPTLVSALLLAEDQRFWSHRGVDAWALLRSGLRLMSRGVEDRGRAQTISMRVVRDLLPTTSDRWSDRLVQMFRARQLERLMDKHEILSAFCARARFGEAVRGFGAAAQRWFGVDAAVLAPAQAATLVAAMEPDLRSPEALKQRRDRLLRSLSRRGLLPRRARDQALARPLGLSHVFISPESQFRFVR